MVSMILPLAVVALIRTRSPTRKRSSTAVSPANFAGTIDDGGCARPSVSTVGVAVLIVVYAVVTLASRVTFDLSIAGREDNQAQGSKDNSRLRFITTPECED